jgi:hypothetical protein
MIIKLFRTNMLHIHLTIQVSKYIDQLILFLLYLMHACSSPFLKMKS